VYSVGDYYRIDGIGSKDATHPSLHKEWIQSADISIQGNIADLVHALQNEEILIVSDGSTKAGHSTAAWVISTEKAFENQNYIVGIGHIPEDNTDSHRAESFGILGGMITWERYKQIWDVRTKFPLKVGCDNEAVINIVSKQWKYKYITAANRDFDVIMAIRRLKKESDYTFIHVKGHKDETSDELTALEKFNCKANDLARQANTVESATVGEMAQYMLPHEEWQIYLDRQKVYSNVESQIREYCSIETIKMFWNKKEKVNENGFVNVDWRALELAMKNEKISTKQWVVKRAAKECGTNMILFQRKQRQNDECPFCRSSETPPHVYKCQHEEVAKKWNECMNDCRQGLINDSTDPIIIEALMYGLQTWRDGHEMEGNILVAKQQDIGWEGILDGFIGIHWREQQDKFNSDC
jgi:hypothetical protein